MTEMKRFVEERNAALFSLDRKKIKAYMHKNGIPIPQNEIVFWAGVCKAICCLRNAPADVAEQARAWLMARGMKPGIG